MSESWRYLRQRTGSMLHLKQVLEVQVFVDGEGGAVAFWSGVSWV
jgi:hypothetical protein